MPWTKIKAEENEPQFHDTETGANRILAYPQAINEALALALEIDPKVFVMGQGVDDASGMFGATRGLQERFGNEKVFDTPLAETGLTGVAVGAAIAGMRPVYFHNRPDFLLLAMDQLVNHASKWSYMFAGESHVPLVIWACIGRGWGSAAQHSQALHGLLASIPGLKVVMPSTCYDAKGLMLSAIADPNPVVIIDHRFNFKQRGPVPAEAYYVPIGKAAVRRKGGGVTVVAVSHLMIEAFHVSEQLAGEGIEVELVEPRTLRPLDSAAIIASVQKTGRLVIVDPAWKTGGFSAEVAAVVAEQAFGCLKAPVARVTLPDLPTPAGYTLENAYYIGAEEIRAAIRTVMDYA